MKSLSVPLVFLALASALHANIAPTVTIQSATMRPGTTLMDVVYRVNDPDDATVKTRALAFVDGTRSFAKVIRPVTFVEGTAAKLGDAIASNANHTLTWDVAADWDVDLGQVKFEVLAMDGRGLLPFDWISIPAAGGKPALTISKDAPSDPAVLSALFWQFADGDPGLTLQDGILRGSAANGNLVGLDFANGTTLKSHAAPFVMKRMNLDPADSSEVGYASGQARAGLLNPGGWHAANHPYDGLAVLIAWGNTTYGQTTIPNALSGVTAVAGRYYHTLALKNDGTVVGWGHNTSGQTNIPAGLTDVTAIAAGYAHSLALKSDGTVVVWGSNTSGQAAIPPGLAGVVAIGSGVYCNLALKSDGTVVGWGTSSSGQTSVPAGLTGVTAIEVGSNHCLALKSNGTVVGWGGNENGQSSPPAGLTGVTAIAAGENFSMALKSDGTVVGWGRNHYGELLIPAGLSGVTAISTGVVHTLALKSDGTVVSWGWNTKGQTTVPAGLSGVTSIEGVGECSFILKAEAP